MRSMTGGVSNSSPLIAYGNLSPLYQEGGHPLRRGRADEYPQGAGRICNAPSSRTAALGIGPYKHERGAAKNRRSGRTGSSAPTRGAAVDSGRRADEYPQGAGRICNAPSSRTAALGIGPYKHERGAAEDRGATIPQSPTATAPFTQGSLFAAAGIIVPVFRVSSRGIRRRCRGGRGSCRRAGTR